MSRKVESNLITHPERLSLQFQSQTHRSDTAAGLKPGESWTYDGPLWLIVEVLLPK